MDSDINDQQIAESIRQQLGDTEDVEQVFVRGDTLQLHVTDEFYRRMASDRERARKIVLAFMQQMRTLTKLQDVTVRVYCQKEKMIEGKAKPWGGDNLTYMNDL